MNNTDTLATIAATTGATRFWTGIDAAGNLAQFWTKEPNAADHPGLTITGHITLPLVKEGQALAAPAPAAPVVESQPGALTDADIDAVWNEVGGTESFLKSFGYRQFARAIADRVELPAAAPGDDDTQQWASLTGAVAWHLIDRHGEDWNDIGNKMEAWGKARFAAPAAPVPAASEGTSKREVPAHVLASMPWSLDHYESTGIVDKDGFGIIDVSETAVLDDYAGKLGLSHWADSPDASRELGEDEADELTRWIIEACHAYAGIAAPAAPATSDKAEGV